MNAQSETAQQNVLLATLREWLRTHSLLDPELPQVRAFLFAECAGLVVMHQNHAGRYQLLTRNHVSLEPGHHDVVSPGRFCS